MKILLADLENRKRAHPEYVNKLLEKGKLDNGFIEISQIDYASVGKEHLIQIKKNQVIEEISLKRQPGDLLAIIINKLTGEQPCKRCQLRQQQMNAWGWWGCWKHRKTIIRWLCEEAGKRGYNITQDGAMELFKAAFSTQFIKRAKIKEQIAVNHPFYQSERGKSILEYVEKNLKKLEVNSAVIEKSDISSYHLEIFLAYWNTPVFVQSTQLLKRLFHPVIQVPRKSRKFLKLKTGEQPIEVDFPQTFPTLLLSLYDDVNCIEAEEYKKLLTSKKFYDYITQGKLPYPKKNFMQFLFSEHLKTDSETWGVISQSFEKFPKLYQKILENRGPEFSVILQNLEAEIFIEGVIPFCIKEKIFIIPMHDGYFLLEKDLFRVQEFLNHSLQSKIGYAPKLEKKNES